MSERIQKLKSPILFVLGVYKKLLRHCAKIHFEQGVSKKAFSLISVVVALYSASIVSLSFLLDDTNFWWYSIVFSALVVAFYYIITYFAYKITNGAWIKINEKQKFCWSKFIITFIFMAVPFFINYLYWYPGINNLDTIGQWEQVLGFSFHDWHPVFHTFLIWLTSRIHESYAFAVLVQNILFCLALTHLFSTLERWGVSKKILIILFGLIVVTPTHLSFMQCLFKDCAFTIVLTFITTIIIDLQFEKKGVEWKRALALGVLIGMATFLRHNALFYTIPLLVILVMKFWRNRCAKVLAFTFVMTAILIKGVLYPVLKVTYPNNQVAEAVGWSMTILGNVYVENPMSLDDETRAFLLSYANDDIWQNEYHQGDFDSIKWNTAADYDVLSSTPPQKYISMTIRAVRDNPAIAFEAIRNLTSPVWNINSEHNFLYFTDREFLEEDMDYEIIERIQNNELPYTIGKHLRTLLSIPYTLVPQLLTTNIGLHILLLLICFAATFPLVGTKGLILVLPTIFYCFLTMTLLSSVWEHRIFHFVLIVSFPTCITLLAAYKDINSEECEVYSK